MKKLCTIILIGTFMTSFSQSDIIYPLDGSNPIIECEITVIHNGNIVYYLKNETPRWVEAKSIKIKGLYTELNANNSNDNGLKSNIPNKQGVYRGHNYNYYQNLRIKSTNQRDAGMFMFFLGFGCEVAGYLMVIDDKITNDGAGQILILGGAILSNIGIPLWIAGGVKRANNKKAMELTQDKMNISSLSIKPTNNGLGLVLNF
jgi:hypothetical protein